jgi:glycosyltransferase involved in cell wall biosynthesis
MRFVGPRFDRVIAVTDSQVSSLIELGYPASRIRVIPNGIAEPEPRRDRADVRGELGVGDDELLALLVAVLRPEKQAPRFVDAVAEARRRGCPVRGVVAGSGPELPEVQRRAAASEGVVALGERRDVADLMSAADVVCLTSRAEGLPIVVLEAMALARPILSPAIGGIPDAIGDHGILVGDDSVDAIAAALCAAAQERDRLGALGRGARARFRERFSLDRAAESYARVLREVTEGGAGAE